MQIKQTIAPCLWFDHQGEEAARFYTAIFPNSKILGITKYGKAGYEIHHQPAGSVMTVAFELDGQLFTALNAGPLFKFNEAIPFRCCAIRRRKSTHIGRSCRKAAIQRRSSADGSKTSSAFRGRSIPKCFTRC